MSRPVPGCEIVERGADSRDRLVAAVEGGTEDRDDADGVLVARARRPRGSRCNRSPSIGTSRGSTSQKFANLSQQTWTLMPMTIFGRSVGLPAALRCCQRRLSASPRACTPRWSRSSSSRWRSCGSGAFQRSASIPTHRCSSSAVRGYSSLSIMFLSKHSSISPPACGSVQVVTKRGEVETGVAVEHQLVVHDLIGDIRVERAIGQGESRNPDGLVVEHRVDRQLGRTRSSRTADGRWAWSQCRPGDASSLAGRTGAGTHPDPT